MSGFAYCPGNFVASFLLCIQEWFQNTIPESKSNLALNNLHHSRKALAPMWPRWCIGMRLRLYEREEKGSLLLWISSKTSQSSFVHKKISAFFLTKCRSFNLAIFFVERENWIRTFTTALGPLSCPIIGSLKKRNTKQRNCTLGSRELK